MKNAADEIKQVIEELRFDYEFLDGETIKLLLAAKKKGIKIKALLKAIIKTAPGQKNIFKFKFFTTDEISEETNTQQYL